MKEQKDTLQAVQEALVKWFRSGVTYTKKTFSYTYFSIPEYDNLPSYIEHALLDAQRQIVFNLLKRKRIPQRLWPGVLQLSPPYPINPSQIKGPAVSPIWGPGLMSFLPPAVFPVYKTEGLIPKERAEHITKLWHDATVHLWSNFLDKGRLETDTTLTGIDLERELDKEGSLTKLAANPVDRLILQAHSDTYRSREIADLLSRVLGISASANQIRKRIHRLTKKIKEKVEHPEG